MMPQLDMPTNTQKKFRILLAEDNETEALVLQAHLRKSDVPFETRTVSNGMELLEHLQEEKGNFFWPDVIILDINMPRMTGLDALKKIKVAPATRHIPVLMLTHSQTEKDIKEAQSLGAQGYVVKGATVSLDEIINFARVAKDYETLWICLGAAEEKVH